MTLWYSYLRTDRSDWGTAANDPKGKTISTTYNAYSLLRSVEDLLGYEPLARAKSARSFVKDVLRDGS